MSFDPDGKVTCLWTDKIPLAELGTLKIKRASTIEFNGESQLWEVRMGDDPKSPVVHTDTSRAACVTWEIETIQATL
ncbi:MAG: hypothetical protein JWM68_3744 [Verrucomicrobiales bacterium]|nr:hypothetical protein [Verrucomicrobiales bacterium]